VRARSAGDLLFNVFLPADDSSTLIPQRCRPVTLTANFFAISSRSVIFYAALSVNSTANSSYQ
jgi:hypothetical protein